MSADKFKEAIGLLYAGHAMEAKCIGEQLIAERDEGDQLSGYLCLGLIYEEGGPGVPRDLDAATLHYHKAAFIAGEPLTFCYLARVTMKKGVAHYAAALKYLEEARKLGNPAEVLLGLAHYYRSRSVPDVQLAKRYYVRAALRGRFAGFFGYSSVAREIGQNGRALAMDVIRVVLGPLLALLIGSATQDEF